MSTFNQSNAWSEHSAPDVSRDGVLDQWWKDIQSVEAANADAQALIRRAERQIQQLKTDITAAFEAPTNSYQPRQYTDTVLAYLDQTYGSLYGEDVENWKSAFHTHNEDLKAYHDREKTALTARDEALSRLQTLRRELSGVNSLGTARDHGGGAANPAIQVQMYE